jgi:hypothetical protein
LGALKEKVQKKYKLKGKEVNYFVFSGVVSNDTYRPDKLRINILAKDGSTQDISEASDQLGIDTISRTVKKYFLCCPKEHYPVQS